MRFTLLPTRRFFHGLTCLLAVTCSGLLACGDDDNPTMDAGADASLRDVGLQDGAPDSANEDAALTDSGIDDAAPSDAAPTDAGLEDTGPSASILPPGDTPALPVDGARTFEEVVEALPQGEWVQYETGAPENYFYNGRGGHQLDWADSAEWDATSQCLLHYGGGHIMVPALSIYCVRTNEWIRGPLPHWLDLDADSPWGYTNHGYDRNSLDTENRILYFTRGRAVWRYELATNEWHQAEVTHGNSYLRDFGEFVPGLGLVTGVGESSTLYAYAPSSGEQTRLDAPFHHQLHTFGEYSPRTGQTLYGGGDGNLAVYLLEGDGSGRQVADSPQVIRTVSSGGSGGWVLADPNSDDFLVLFATNAELHRYSPADDAWTMESMSPFREGMRRMMATAAPEYGVLIFASRISDTSAHITLYRP